MPCIKPLQAVIPVCPQDRMRRTRRVRRLYPPGPKGEGVASEPREACVDVHSHFVPALPRFDEVTGDDRWPSVRDTGETRSLIAGGAVQRVVDPTYESVAARVERVERARIDLQVLSPLPPLLPQWAGSEL